MIRSTDITLDDLIVVRSEASALIRSEVRAGDQRARLERAIWDAINKLGRTVDAVSEASGLTPAEIRKIAERTPDIEAEIAA